MREAVIVSAVRTPTGSFRGVLNRLPATALGSLAIGEALKRVGLDGRDVDEVIMGNVLSAGLGQAPARQASLGAGLPNSVPCTTVNKVCGSGLKAVILAAQAIRLREADLVVAGGMESMSNVPYLLESARGGYRLGHGTLVDGLIKDGLWDVSNDFSMGEAAELCAERFRISRKEQDAYAIMSWERALAASRRGDFLAEIIPVEAPTERGDTVVLAEDEGLGRFDREKMAGLKPAFRQAGTVTAGNASPMSDGAAALVIMARESAARLGISPLARIVEASGFALEPEWFTLAPAGAVKGLLRKTGRTPAEIDLFEINEAFAASSIAVNRDLGLDPEKVNVRGGAIALGHPLGATGARILTTLVHALQGLGKTRGVASLCIGGGEALALMVERDRN
jgi:acetyl-CoA C-acetyltransferase